MDIPPGQASASHIQIQIWIQSWLYLRAINPGISNSWASREVAITEELSHLMGRRTSFDSHVISGADL